MSSLIDQFNNLTIKAEKLSVIQSQAKKLLTLKNYYLLVTKYTNVPWYVVGVIHMRESGFSLNHNLCNGEPLNKITKLVPKGYGPWNTWTDSAVFAMKYENFDHVTDWSLGKMLDLLERYNGLGYRNRGLVSPYLFSMSDRYISGKFVEKYVPLKGYKSFYDPKIVDQQVGCATMLKYLELQKAIEIER